MYHHNPISFPRATRFQNLRLSSVETPYYNIPSTIRKRSISIGERPPIKLKITSPSPQHYQVGSTIAKNGRSFGIGRDVFQSFNQRMYSPAKGFSTPGPDQYVLPSTLKKIGYSMRHKLRLKTESDGPGPGAYYRQIMKTII